MKETLTEQEYRDELTTQAGYLVEAVEEDPEEDWSGDPHEAALEAVADVLDAHDWFFKNQYGPAVHGAVIQHSSADPSRYSDWESRMQNKTPEGVVESIAYDCFEADVVEAAKERLAHRAGQE